MMSIKFTGVPWCRKQIFNAVLLLASWGFAAIAEDVSETYFDFDKPESAQEWSYYWGKGGSGNMKFASEPVKSGKGAGKLSFAFSKTDDYFVMSCTRPLPEGINTVKLQVYGDNSGQQLSCRIIDRTGECFLYPLSTGIDWTGWKEFTINTTVFGTSWGGNNDKIVDNPAHLAFEMKASKPGSGSIHIDRITTVSSLSENNQIIFKLKSAQSGNIFFTGKQGSVMQAEFYNRGSTPKNLGLSYRLTDQDGKVLEKDVKQVQVPLQAATNMVDIPLKLQGKLGYYNLTADLLSGERVLRHEAVSIALIVPQMSGADSPFGLNLSLGSRYAPSNMDSAAALAESLGMKWSREEFSWESIESIKGTFQWEKMDRALEIAGKHNIKVLGLLGYCATWARKNPEAHTSPPRDVNEYATFVGQVVSRYKDKIKYWEIWNEPDSPVFWPPKSDSKEYGELLKAAYQAAKRADPDCHVMTAGLLVGINHSGNWSFLEDLYKNGGKDYFDILALHAYCDPRSPEEGGYTEKLKKLREIMTKYGDGKKSLWLTEQGWPTASGKKNYVVDKSQADYLVRSHVLALASPGVDKYFWFLMNDGGNWESDYEQSYGILRSNWTSKPSGVAYSAMTRILGSAKFAETIQMKDPVKCQVFNTPAESILVMWSSGAGEAKVQTDIVQNRISGIMDIYGNAISAFADNKFTPVLTASPIYIKIKPDALNELKAKLSSANVAVSMPVEKEPTETKLLDDFEDVGWGHKWKLGWLGSGHEGTVMSSSAEQMHGGKTSGKIDYQADPDKGKYGLCYVEVDHEIPLPYESKKIGLWVYGDNSGNNLSIRIQDVNKEIFQYDLAKKIDWQGWKYLEATVGKPDSKFGGDKNGSIDYPITFQGILIGIVPKRKANGTIYVDDLIVKY